MRLTRRGETVAAVAFLVLILAGMGVAGWVDGLA
jgi:hypothetical protein